MVDERRSGHGRRKDDGTCVLHDVVSDHNLKCFSVIKETIKANDIKTEKNINILYKELEHRLEVMKNDIDKKVDEKASSGAVRILQWGLGGVLTLIVFFAGLTLSAISDQITDTHNDVKTIGKDVDSLRITHMRDNVILQGVADKQNNIIKIQKKVIRELGITED